MLSRCFLCRNEVVRVVIISNRRESISVKGLQVRVRKYKLSSEVLLVLAAASFKLLDKAGRKVLL